VVFAAERVAPIIRKRRGVNYAPVEIIRTGERRSLGTARPQDIMLFIADADSAGRFARLNDIPGAQPNDAPVCSWKTIAANSVVQAGPYGRAVRLLVECSAGFIMTMLLAENA
jgi:hypothetical protein